MDIVTSEARSPAERMILEDPLRNEEITVKEEPLITAYLVPEFSTNVKEEPWTRTPPPPSLNNIEVKEEPWTRTPPPPSLNNIGVVDLVEDDDDDAVQNSDHLGMDITHQTPLVTDFLTVDLEEESGATKSTPAFDNVEGNGEPQHYTMKQQDDPNSVMHNASVRRSLRLIETNSKASIAQEPECYEPIQINPHSKQSQANTESDSEQEPQCLGPFVESSSIKCYKCSVTLTECHRILKHSCIIEHIRREEMKEKLKCCFCEKEYGNVYSLRKHIKRYVRKTYVKCSVCGVHLTSISSFKSHALIHTNQWPYRCDICGQGSASEYHLELHKTIHSNEKSWMCDVCGAMFPNELRLNGHKLVHSERKYECDLCFAKFRERYQVKEHKKKVHSVRKKKFQCEDCTSAFTSKYTLKLHKEMKHDDNSGGEIFVCSMCHREFNHRYAFGRHMYKHKMRNENVIYTCDMCKRNFVTKSSLTRHILEHSGKQFSCSHCGMLFTQPSSVKRHMLKLHGSD